jgi:hypothetical protein
MQPIIAAESVTIGNIVLHSGGLYSKLMKERGCDWRVACRPMLLSRHEKNNEVTRMLKVHLFLNEPNGKP